MAIGWFTVLKSVPWSTVIGNAPVVADGARKLWKAVANRPAATAPAESESDGPPATGGSGELASLRAELLAVQAAAAKLDEQMLASSELIKALAEQNTQLVERVEALRVRSLWLTGATLLLGIVVAAGLVVWAAQMTG